MSDASSWYARKFGTQASRHQTTPAAAPPATHAPVQPQFQQPGNVPPGTSMSGAISAGDSAGGYQTQQLLQKVQNDRCPNCGSSDFLQHQNTVPRCFSCGYAGGRFTHELG